jgi:phosphate transport system substrate-binding protein
MNRLPRFATLTVLAALFALPPALPSARADDLLPISVVGSEAVFPLAVAAAERFSLQSGQAMPVVERNGTARGIEIFCAGQGLRSPDLLTAERRLERNELSLCSRRGIGLQEIKFGYQAVALAQSRAAPDPLSLTRRQLFLALAAQVPVQGRMIANPYRLWSDIDFALPVKPIAAVAPPRSSPLWDSFVALMMQSAADDFPELRRWSPGQRAELAGQLRGDGVVEILQEDEASVGAALARQPGAVGVVSFNYLTAQAGSLRGLPIDGVAPSLASIAQGRYAPSRPFYLYVKNAHLNRVRGLAGYLAEITGAAASGPGGYLTARGLVALPPEERAALR